MSIEDATVTVENAHTEHLVNIRQVDVDVQYITVPSVFSLLLFLKCCHLNSVPVVNDVVPISGVPSQPMQLPNTASAAPVVYDVVPISAASVMTNGVPGQPSDCTEVSAPSVMRNGISTVQIDGIRGASQDNSS